ncbi:MAG: aminotransferase class III-fold pyridoxal phosphate-dependent enzyme [Phycisphaeraceae bacterium]
MTQTNATIARHDQFMTLNYPRFPVTITEGRGSWLTDSQGGKYLDLFAGFGAGILGHCHPDLVAAATKQLNKVWHVGNLLHTEPQTQLAEQIAEKGFGGRSFFCHSGSDANEAAFKLARLYGQGKRHKIIATLGSFHGRGFASMMATGQDKVRAGFAPYLPGFEHVPYNDIIATARAIDEQTIAIIVEPIQGEGGVQVPDPDYLRELRRLCDEHDLLLICDEVWTGCGRTGRWFGYQHFDIEPDIMTLGKAVGAGMAVGVMTAGPRCAELYDARKQGAVRHATTLGGNCVAMAVSHRMFEVIERDNLLERATTLGETAMQRLHDFGRQTGLLREVRGKGLFIGAEMNLETNAIEDAATVVQRCLGEGLLLCAAQQGVIRLAPSLTVTEDELDQGLTILERVLKAEAA